jgi:hypothetical protein
MISFNLTDEHLAEIKSHLVTEKKMDYHFKVEIKDDEGKLIADVVKVLYIRKK